MQAKHKIKRFTNGVLKTILNIVIIFVTILNFGFFIKVVHDNDRVNALISDIDNFLLEHQKLDEKFTNTLNEASADMNLYLTSIELQESLKDFKGDNNEF